MSQRFRVFRDGHKDFVFDGELIAESKTSKGSIRTLYRTDSGKYVVWLRTLDDNGSYRDEAYAFDTIPEVAAFLNDQFGELSYTMKNLFENAAKINSDFASYAFEEL